MNNRTFNSGSQQSPRRPVGTQTRQSYGCMAAFFGIFAIVGLAAFGMFTVPLVRDLIRATGWESAPGQILTVGIKSSRGSKSTTYRPEATYQYRHRGRTFKGDRIELLKHSGSYSTAEAWTAAHPAGSQVEVWVNPDNPTEAVLDRDMHPSQIVALIPLIFAAIGLGGIFFAIRSMRKMSTSLAGDAATASAVLENLSAGNARTNILPRSTASPDGELKPATSRLTKFLVPLIIGVLFGGVACFISVKNGPGFMVGIFGLVGAGLLVAAGHGLLAMFNPVVRLIPRDTTFELGRDLHIRWITAGSVNRIQHLAITLKGTEVAIYRRGTDTVTSRHVFAETPLLDCNDHAQMAEGAGAFPIPADAMHSFDSGNNRIEWTLEVKGTIANFPDIADTYPVTILPAGHHADL